MASAAAAAGAASSATDTKITGAAPANADAKTAGAAASATPKGHVDIRGIDKQQLLKAMWSSTKSATFFGGGFTQPTYQAASQSELGCYIDYHCGRPIKSNLSGDSVDPWLYNRDAPKGSGALQSIVDSLRSGGGIAPEPQAPEQTCWGCRTKIHGDFYSVKGRALCGSCRVMFGPMLAAKD